MEFSESLPPWKHILRQKKMYRSGNLEREQERVEVFIPALGT